MTIKFTEDAAADGVTDQRLILLSDSSLRAIHTPQELHALLAILSTFSHPGEGAEEDGLRKPNIGEYLGALAFEGIAQAIDPIDPRDPQDQYRREYTLPGALVQEDSPAGTARGRAALRLISKLGSCSAAALNVIDRLKGEYRSLPESRRPPLARLAAQIRAQFGALAMPPDVSCIHD